MCNREGAKNSGAKKAVLFYSNMLQDLLMLKSIHKHVSLVMLAEIWRR